MSTTVAITQAELDAATTSLGNIGELLRDTHNFSLGTLETLFQVEEQPAIPDESVWQMAGAALFLGVVGSVPYVGALVAGVCAATYIVATHENAPAPTDFKGALADVSNWLDASFEGAITKVDHYAANVEANWNTPISAPGYPTATIAALAQYPVPAKGTEGYDTLWVAATQSVKRAMWRYTLDKLFMVVEYNNIMGRHVSGTSPTDVDQKLIPFAGDLTSYYPVYGVGNSYQARQKVLAYNRSGDIKTVPASVASWIFRDDAREALRPADQTDTAFTIHSEVFGAFDQTTGVWTHGTGWVTKHLPFG